MPNRNSFDEREKYDHSNHATTHRQSKDLKSPANPDSSSSSDDIHPRNHPASGVASRGSAAKRRTR